MCNIGWLRAFILIWMMRSNVCFNLTTIRHLEKQTIDKVSQIENEYGDVQYEFQNILEEEQEKFDKHVENEFISLQKRLGGESGLLAQGIETLLDFSDADTKCKISNYRSDASEILEKVEECIEKFNDIWTKISEIEEATTEVSNLLVEIKKDTRNCRKTDEEDLEGCYMSRILEAIEVMAKVNELHDDAFSKMKSTNRVKACFIRRNVNNVANTANNVLACLPAISDYFAKFDNHIKRLNLYRNIEKGKKVVQKASNKLMDAIRSVKNSVARRWGAKDKAGNNKNNAPIQKKKPNLGKILQDTKENKKPGTGIKKNDAKKPVKRPINKLNTKNFEKIKRTGILGRRTPLSSDGKEKPKKSFGKKIISTVLSKLMG